MFDGHSDGLSLLLALSVMLHSSIGTSARLTQV